MKVEGSHKGTKITKRSRDEALEELARIVIDCGRAIHRELGPGLLESAYEALLAEALRQRGISPRRQQADPRIESIERLSPVHGKQLLTYLRLSKLPLGLLMNFGQAMFKDGLKRVANDYYAHE